VKAVKIVTRSIFVFLLLTIALCGWGAEPFRFTILHTNDLHGMMRPFDYTPMLSLLPGRKDAGGLARRAALIAEIRRTASDPVVLVDSGDVFTRGPWHTRHFGMPEVEAMNLMGYDMLCVGNNEFKATDGTDAQAKMLALLRRSRFPWLAANLTVGDTGVAVEGVHPFIVRTIGPVRVGFLGVTAPRAAEYPQVKGWTISDPIAAAKRWAPIARMECDILIAVTHIGVNLDEQLAKQVSGIDAIVGGDSHTTIARPLLVNNPEGRQVPIVQAGEHGVWLGRLDLIFTQEAGAWRLTAHEGKLLPINNTLPDDPAMLRLLEQWLDPVAAGIQPLRLAA
jgi:2',3'-cyclic-nucleotide 2'-phosphodiesterase (5'-nucleotidase family)